MKQSVAPFPISAPQAPASLLFRLLRAAWELEERLEEALNQVDLSLPKLGVLKALAQADQPITLSGLADCNRCVRSNITQLVDRLEGEGLVRRVNDPADRRIRRAALTPAGHKACADGLRVVAAQERQLAEALSSVDTTALGRALKHLAG